MPSWRGRSRSARRVQPQNRFSHRPDYNVIYQFEPPNTNSCILVGNLESVSCQDVSAKYLVTCMSKLPREIGQAELSRYKAWMLVNANDIKQKHAAGDVSWKTDLIRMVLFANLAYSDGCSVLFHCKAGKHRSGAIAMLYLIWKFQRNPDVVRNYVRGQRRRIDVQTEWSELLWAWYNEVMTNERTPA